MGMSEAAISAGGGGGARLNGKGGRELATAVM